jgi:NTP pyrophosphatase (non-canonical NTP hydrolase)
MTVPTDDDIRAYERFVRDNWLRTGTRSDISENELRSLYVMSAGLAGETGEVMEILKKHIRDDSLDRGELLLELGDLLFYLTRIGQEFGLSLREIMAANTLKLTNRYRQRQPA